MNENGLTEARENLMCRQISPWVLHQAEDRHFTWVRRLAGVMIWMFFLLMSYPVIGEAAESQEIVLGEGEFMYHATVEIDGCRVSLERRKNESHLLHFRHDCHQALEEKLALLGRMLETLVPDSEDRRTIRTLFVGRFVLTLPEFTQRVATAVSDSPDWDAKRAWSEPGYSNRFVFQLIKEEISFQS